MIGQRLGQYEITALLGQGGMATVYRARQASVDRDVAIKVIKAELAQSSDFVKRFNREARIVAALSHPHILKIYDFAVQEDIAYLVMELLTGGSLAQALEKQPLLAEHALAILEQIGSALDYAHEMGVIHRDLKPHNVLLDARQNAFLTDFGIATLANNTDGVLTQSGAAMGTPAYMAPEQWRAEQTDARTDLYSLSVMLYEMLGGSLPFKATTPYGMMHAHINLEPPPLHTIRSGIPPQLSRVFEKALAKDVAGRFGSAAELAVAVKNAFGGQTGMRFSTVQADSSGPGNLEDQTLFGVDPQPAEPLPGNPFFNRSGIHNRAYFINRNDETRQVLSLLKNGQSVSLVGQRRIGKTSLLFHVSTPEVFEYHGLRRENYVFVYIDCGSLAELSPQGIYQALLEELHDALTAAGLASAAPAVLHSTEPISYRQLERSLRDWLIAGQQVTFILDEFERLSRNPALDPDFFSGLRALATRHAIAFVTASKLPLLALTYADSSTLSSPFFNIFATIRLPLFSDDAARLLLDRMTALAGLSFSAATIDTILSVAGPHPLLLQLAGYEAFELQQTRAGPLDETDGPELARRFLAAAEQHFAYYWRDLNASEQQLLATLPAAQNSDLETVRSLEQKSLIIRLNNEPAGYGYLSEAFRYFVQNQPVAGLIQAGPIVIDQRKRRVLRDGEGLALTELQYELLRYLAVHPGEVVTNEALEQALWGDVFVEDPERLKSVVKGLRRTLGDHAEQLENVRGVGYRWRISD